MHMTKPYGMLVLVAMLAALAGAASAGSIEEEDEKARQGGYEKEYEEAMRRNEGTRTKQEHDKLHEREEKYKVHESNGTVKGTR